MRGISWLAANQFASQERTLHHGVSMYYYYYYYYYYYSCTSGIRGLISSVSNLPTPNRVSFEWWISSFSTYICFFCKTAVSLYNPNKLVSRSSLQSKNRTPYMQATSYRPPVISICCQTIFGFSRNFVSILYKQRGCWQSAHFVKIGSATVMLY
jgi:hypothetical protein